MKQYFFLGQTNAVAAAFDAHIFKLLIERDLKEKLPRKMKKRLKTLLQELSDSQADNKSE